MTQDYDPRPGINGTLERLQAENARLRKLLEDVAIGGGYSKAQIENLLKAGHQQTEGGK